MLLIVKKECRRQNCQNQVPVAEITQSNCDNDYADNTEAVIHRDNVVVQKAVREMVSCHPYLRSLDA